jgi:hypothetical protein
LNILISLRLCGLAVNINRKGLPACRQAGAKTQSFFILTPILMRSLFLTVLASCLLILAPSFQIIKTTLNLTVRDEVGNTVEGATVQLFETEEDYTAEKNIAAEGVTDAKGILKLKDLKAMSYFVIVRKDDKDNSGGGERTGKLEEKRINKVTIVIQ